MGLSRFPFRVPLNDQRLDTQVIVGIAHAFFDKNAPLQFVFLLILSEYGTALLECHLIIFRNRLTYLNYKASKKYGTIINWVEIDLFSCRFTQFDVKRFSSVDEFFL